MDREERNDMVEALIEELYMLDDGTSVSTLELMNSLGEDTDQYDFSDMMDIHDQLFRHAKKKHIKLYSPDYDGTPVGIPYAIDYVVSNKDAQIMCPRCGSRNTAKYIYGMPAYSDRLKQRIDSGKLILGGCCIRSVEVGGQIVWIMPERRCNKCRKNFGQMPLIIAKDKRTAEDYMDAIQSVQFSIHPSRKLDSFDVNIKKTQSGADLMIRKGFEQKTGHITSSRWYSFLSRMLYDYYIFDWKKNYTPKDYAVLDGESWSLELSLTGDRVRSWHGNNAYPPYWKEILRDFKSFK